MALASTIRISLSEHLQPISSPATVFLQVHALCGSRCLWHLRHHISRIQHLQPEWCQFFLCGGSLRHWARHNRNKNDNTIDLFCSSLLNIMCFSVFVQHRTTEKKIGKKKERNMTETWCGAWTNYIILLHVIVPNAQMFEHLSPQTAPHHSPNAWDLNVKLKG